MNIFRLSLANLRYHKASNLFHVIVLALGVALVIMLLLISQQLQTRFTRDLEGIDLVVGAKGSPLQLILSSVFHLDAPTGNMPLKEAEKLEANPLVKSAIPVALGDSYHGYRIVGTNENYAFHYNAQLAEGSFWTQPMQAVIGAQVASTQHLTLGQSFVGTHGITEGGEEHTAFPYKIVGILQPTGSVLDRLVLTDVASVWNVHEHHVHDPDDKDEDEEEATPPSPLNREITSLLLTYKSPYAAVTLPRLINKTSVMQAASPAMETARLFHIIGIGSDTLAAFAGLLIAIAAIGFGVTLWSAINERKYDIALMRSLGATRGKIFGFVAVEGLVLGLAGIVLGIVLGHVLAYAVSYWLQASRHIMLQPLLFLPSEFIIFGGALCISAIVAILPAFTAYRVNVATYLARGA